MTKKWFQIGIVCVFLLSLALRFWGLGRFNTLVFDEVYYAKFGNNYLTHIPFFDGHPPLGKYMITLGMWIANHIPFPQGEVNGYTGAVRSPVSYRWMNAFTGSFIPLLVAAIAYQLSYRRTFALLAGLFTALDGLLLVESRYALINIYIVIFGLLAQWFLLLALASQRNNRRSLCLVLSGISFGASSAVKWNGLWFLLGAYLLWIVAWIWQWLKTKDELPVGITNKPSVKFAHHPLPNLTQINVFQIIFYLGIIPALVYSIIWIPHLQMDTRYGFVEVHKQILNFHEQLGGNSPTIHPYCAEWYKWPLLTRPMAYFYQTAQSLSEPLPVMGPPLPTGSGKVFYDVHAMGNPFLWWFGFAAILFLFGLLVAQIVIFWITQKRFSTSANLSVDTWIYIYLVVNYVANLMPWVRVNRCIFIYHYMGSAVFAFLAIAYFVDQCLRSYYRELRILGITITFIIIISFVFWMPIYLGLPLSPEAYKIRMWFKSWI